MMYVFFNNKTYDILTMAHSEDMSFDVQAFLSAQSRYGAMFFGINADDISFTAADSAEYDECILRRIEHSLSINPITKKMELKIKPNKAADNKHLVYDQQEVKRPFTKQDVSSMYYKDYLDFNLRNLAKSGCIEIGFEYLSELNIRTGISNIRWESFFTDPFLEHMSEDKLSLGRDIMRKGTYYPLFVCTSNKGGFHNAVVEGNHRAISLKLLQLHGELSEEFRILCVRIPESCAGYQTDNLYQYTDDCVGTRYVFETKFGSSVLCSATIFEKAKQSVYDDGGTFHNEYTIEKKTNNIGDLLFGIHSYPLWIRDLIYPYREELLPSKIINDEQAFLAWRENDAISSETD